MTTVRDRSAKRARSRLILALALFVVGLAVPIFLLLQHAYNQLELQSLYQMRLESEAVSGRIVEKLNAIIEQEEARSFSEYGFLNVTSDALLKNQAVQVSPLSRFPPGQHVPGLVGYFQLDPDGTVSTPYLPDVRALGLREDSLPSFLNVSLPELRNRQGLVTKLSSVVARVPALSATRSRDRDRALKDESGSDSQRPHAVMQQQRISELDLETKAIPELYRAEKSSAGEALLGSSAQAPASGTKQKLAEGEARNEPSRQARKEQISIPAPAKLEEYLGAQSAELLAKANNDTESVSSEIGSSDAALPAGQAPQPAREEVIMFEGDIDPLQVVLTESRELVFYRKVWRGGTRYIQGFVVSADQLLQAVAAPLFHASSVGDLGDLIVGHGDAVFERIAANSYGSSMRGQIFVRKSKKTALTYRSELPPPLDDFSLLFTAERIPLAVGSALVYGLTAAIVVVLLTGAFAVYRVGLKQIELAEKKSDFVSAVSHELKTPLTTIRMYAEMLRAGYGVEEEKRRNYYDYILGESERLSRLVSNVLELSRLSQGKNSLILKPHTVRELIEFVMQKIGSLVDLKGFALVQEIEPDSQHCTVSADQDSFLQVIINLVDNALKFSRDAERKQVILGCRLRGAQGKEIEFFVRDFGPGVPESEQRKIFQLFYRAEDEMVRTTSGTGIGLALVRELAERMHAGVDMRNAEPGAEFQVRFRAVP